MENSSIYGHLYEDAGDDVPDCLDALLGAPDVARAFPKPGQEIPGDPSL
jgi:hypothetical protein